MREKVSINRSSFSEKLQVWYRNGSGGTWTKFQDILTGSQALEGAGTWTNTGSLDLSGVIDQAGSRIRIQVVSATAPGSVFEHDIGFDNITVNGAP